MSSNFDINYFFKQYFTPSVVSEGRKLFLSEAVSRITFRSGQAVGATVRSNSMQTYRVNILLEQLHHTKSQIVGTCSCSMGFNCKHVAAVLYQLEANMDKAARTISGFETQRYKVWETWLDETTLPAEHYPLAETQNDLALLYVLSFGFDENQAHFLFVDLYQSKFLKKGGISLTAVKPAKLVDMKDLDTLTATDIQLLQQLRHYRIANQEDMGERFRLNPHTPAEFIRTLIQTERAFWQSVITPLQWKDEEEIIHLDWHSLDNGGLKYAPHTADNTCVSLWPITPFLYHDIPNHCVGPIQTTLSADTLKQCLAMPIYYPDQGKFLETPFNAWAHAHHLPPLPVPHTSEELSVTPTARLTLYSIDSALIFLSLTTGARYQRYDSSYSYAKVSFHYGNAACQPDSFEQNLYSLEGDTLFVHPRLWDVEKNFLQQLKERGVYRFDEKSPILIKPEYVHYYYVGNTRDDVLHFLSQATSELPELGWELVYDASFTHAPLAIYDDWYGQIRESHKKDWFSLEVGVHIDDEKINLIPALARALQDNFEYMDLTQILESDPNELLALTLDDGTKIAIPMHRFQTVLSTLTELYDKNSLKEGEFFVNSLLASQLVSKKQDFALSTFRWEMPPEIQNLSEKWLAFPLSKHILHPTDNFKGQLRQYQLEGLTWLQFLRQHRLGGILADDMGLGKTVQTLCHLAMEKAQNRWQKPVLIICPTSLIGNWESEIKRFVPDLSLVILQGAGRPTEESQLRQYDIILSTYSVILHDQDLLAKLSYYYIILDEAQWIKNARTHAFNVVTQLNTEYRLCLTGTPMENHLGELWSLFHFLLPGYLGTSRAFNKLFRLPIEKDNDAARRTVLQKRIAPFLLRRAKSVVASDLPPKNEMIQFIDMDEEQATLYESIRLSVESKIQHVLEEKGFAQSHIEILDALLKLRQVCCDPRLLKLDVAKNIHQSAKLEYLMSTLPEMIEEGRKILLFSSFTSMLSLIERELEEREIPYVLLTGNTQDRQTPIAQFQHGSAPLFLLSLKAGGTGLNLTAADTVIHYDPWWNPAVENQATDRAHRIGQNKAVFIYKLIVRGSLEEKIIHLQERKQALLDDILSGELSTGGKLDASDLEYLLMK